jgi:hypothetical protein
VGFDLDLDGMTEKNSATGAEEMARSNSAKVGARQLRLTFGNENMVCLSVEEDDVVIEAQSTILSYEAVALLLREYNFRTLLDAGCGLQEHARIFRACGKEVTTVDPVSPADIEGDFPDI